MKKRWVVFRNRAFSHPLTHSPPRAPSYVTIMLSTKASVAYVSPAPLRSDQGVERYSAAGNGALPSCWRGALVG